MYKLVILCRLPVSKRRDLDNPSQGFAQRTRSVGIPAVHPQRGVLAADPQCGDTRSAPAAWSTRSGPAVWGDTSTNP